MSKFNESDLRKFIIEHFNLQELQTLCFDLGVNYDLLNGDNLDAKARELILHMQRQGYVDQLIEALKQARPASVPQLDNFKPTNKFISPIRQDETPEQRNRRILLDRVKTFWIEGVLDRSVHHSILIELGKEVHSGAVDHPWETMVLVPDPEPRALPTDTKIIDIFDEMGGSLLILGVPGSGKTITLLELARDAITRAEHNNSQPIPVVLNLSSWALERQTLATWVVDELKSKYFIPNEIGDSWVGSSALNRGREHMAKSDAKIGLMSIKSEQIGHISRQNR